MRSPARYTVEAQDGHRRGVVLGLTLAELLLLLVFCLLLVSAGIIEQKDHQIQQLANAPSSAPGQPDAKDAVAQQLSEKTKELADAGAKAAEADKQIDVLQTELTEVIKQRDRITQNAPDEFRNLTTTISSADWQELVRSRDYVRQLQAEGVDTTTPPTSSQLVEVQRLEQLAVHKGESATAVLTEMENPSEQPGHQWPPIITLGNDRFRFPLNSAQVSSDFRDLLWADTAPKVRKLLTQYDANVVEVVGHTDEQPINSTQASTLDADAIPALNGRVPIGELKPVDNAGLGLARAIAVANELSAMGLPPGTIVIPLSAAQLVKPGDEISDGKAGGNDPSRRRIEIRVRRSDAGRH